MKDLFGKAMLDYQTNNNPENIYTETSLSEIDEMAVSYLFRSYYDMPKIEQTALQLTKGKVLDVGCGAGSHSLYLQNEKKMEVYAIDISSHAITTCKLRGINNVFVQDVMQLKGQKFDTILLLMNGAGMCGRLNRIIPFLKKLKSMLSPLGQILLDSSDIIYMFDEDENGEKWIPAISNYYGEVIFNITYKNEKEVPFDWMYIDYNTLQRASHASGLKCTLIEKGDHYDYLAKLYI